MTPPLAVLLHPSGTITYQEPGDRRDQVQPGDTMIVLVADWLALQSTVDALHIALARQANALAARGMAR